MTVYTPVTVHGDEFQGIAQDDGTVTIVVGTLICDRVAAAVDRYRAQIVSTFRIEPPSPVWMAAALMVDLGTAEDVTFGRDTVVGTSAFYGDVHAVARQVTWLTSADHLVSLMNSICVGLAEPARTDVPVLRSHP
jgi:hypothetical protein